MGSFCHRCQLDANNHRDAHRRAAYAHRFSARPSSYLLVARHEQHLDIVIRAISRFRRFAIGEGGEVDCEEGGGNYESNLFSGNSLIPFIDTFTMAMTAPRRPVSRYAICNPSRTFGLLGA
jgi:hypothetical protein